MDDKDRTLKALEDMKESMAYAVRRKQQIGHEAVPIANGGASTQASGPFYEEEYVRTLEAQRDELAKLLTECLEMADNWPGVAYSYDLSTRCANALAALKVDGTARETSTVAQDK